MKTKANDLFSKLGDEEPQEESKKLRIERTPGLEMILEGLHQCTTLNRYSWALSIVEPLTYTSEDITKLSALLPAFQHYDRFSNCVGHYLSALINKSEEQEFLIVTSDLNIHNLGAYNKGKTINIVGNTGLQGHLL